MTTAKTNLWRQTATYFLLFTGIGMVGGILGPALPFLADQSGSSMSQIAILFTARAVGNMAGSVVSGHLLDRFQGHRVLLGVIFLAIAGMILMPLSPLLWVMTGVVFVLGFAEVSMNAGCNVMIMWWHRERSGPYLSALHFCFSVGAMLVPLLVMLAIHQGASVLWAFWLVAGYLALIGVMLAPQASPVSPVKADHEHVDKAYDLAVFAGILGLFGLYVGMEVTFAGWVTTYGVLSGLTRSDAAFLVSIFWFSLAGGRLLAMPILRRGHYFSLLFSCFGLGMLMMLALIFDALPIIAITLLFGLALSAIFPTLFTLGNELVSLNGKRTGYIFLAAGIGAIVAPSATGPLIEYFGTSAMPLLLLGTLAAMAAGLVLIRLRHTHRQGRPS